MPYIYKIISPKKRIYVGSTININERFKSYYRLKCKTQVRLYNSFKKYGVENHEFIIITECTINEMFNLENYYGNLYNTLDDKFGLNCVLPKAGTTFNSRTLETRLKLSKSNKGKIVSDETKLKLRNINLGKPSKNKGKKIHTEESRNKMRISHTGKILNDNHKNNISKSLKNKLPKNHKLIIEKRSKIVLLNDYNIIFNSISETANFFKISPTIISLILNNKKINKYNISLI